MVVLGEVGARSRDGEIRDKRVVGGPEIATALPRDCDKR